MSVKPYVEPAGLSELLANIDLAPSVSNLVIGSPKQRAALTALSAVRCAHTIAIETEDWSEVTRLGRELFSLARQYVQDFFPTHEQYENRIGRRS